MFLRFILFGFSNWEVFSSVWLFILQSNSSSSFCNIFLSQGRDAFPEVIKLFVWTVGYCLLFRLDGKKTVFCFLEVSLVASLDPLHQQRCFLFLSLLLEKLSLKKHNWFHFSFFSCFSEV